VKKPEVPEDQRLSEDREEAVRGLEEWLDPIMAVLGLAWLVLMIIEMTRGLNRFLLSINYFIWTLFIIDFFIRMTLAPRRFPYLRKNWLTAISLVIPALRIFRVLRALRALQYASVARTTRLIRTVSTMNRGMKILSKTVSRRGLGYVVLLTALFTVTGAAGMYSFERDAPSGGFEDYGDALWWTAMIMTTMGSQYWPQTAEGRLLCLLLATYAFAVFGYVTATIATFFIGLDTEQKENPTEDHETR
jgi:voltage-gated potassium channel